MVRSKISTTDKNNRGARVGSCREGFTLIELLVVIAIVAILASLLLSSLSRVKSKVQGIQCLNNHRQLTLAWRMYTEENDGRLLYSMVSDRGDPLARYAWVLGVLNFNPGNFSNWDLDLDIRRSLLWPYCGKSSAVWRCPADTSSVTYGDFTYPRVRSMAMNFWLGGNCGMAPEWRSDWKVNRNFDDLVDPGPSGTFVLLDMREDSINSGSFLTDMAGYPKDPRLMRFNQDYPASYHHRAGGLSFADGHSEMRRWRDDRTMPPLKKGVPLPREVVPSPHNVDIRWLQERAAGLK